MCAAIGHKARIMSRVWGCMYQCMLFICRLTLLILCEPVVAEDGNRLEHSLCC